jgi:hypothetical protein
MNPYSATRPARPGEDAWRRGHAAHRLARRAAIATPVLVLLCLVVAVLASSGAIGAGARLDTVRAPLETTPAGLSVSELQAALVGQEPLGRPSTAPIVAVAAADPQLWLIGPQPLGNPTGQPAVLPSVRAIPLDLTGPLPVTE